MRLIQCTLPRQHDTADSAVVGVSDVREDLRQADQDPLR